MSCEHITGCFSISFAKNSAGFYIKRFSATTWIWPSSSQHTAMIEKSNSQLVQFLLNIGIWVGRSKWVPIYPCYNRVGITENNIFLSIEEMCRTRISPDAKESSDHIRACLSTPVISMCFPLAVGHFGISSMIWATLQLVKTRDFVRRASWQKKKNDWKTTVTSWKDTVYCEAGPVGIFFLTLLCYFLSHVSFNSLSLSVIHVFFGLIYRLGVSLQTEQTLTLRKVAWELFKHTFMGTFQLL